MGIINGKNVGPRAVGALAVDLLKIVGVGLAAGTALIAGTDAVMKKLTSDKKDALDDTDDIDILENSEEIEEEI